MDSGIISPDDLRCGVYCIHNKQNNKIYIGITTVGFSKRLAQHTNGDSQVIHKSFQKYGLSNFDAYILLEEYDNDLIKLAEQIFIKTFKSNNKSFGYNMTDGGEGTLGFSKPFQKIKHTVNNKGKYYTVIDPDGNLRNVHNLSAFCKSNNLSYSAMTHVVNGTQLEHQGFKLSTKTSEDYFKSISKDCFVKSPDGYVYKVLNRASFCRNFNLTQASFNAMVNRKNGYNSVKGWIVSDNQDWDYDHLINKE